MKLTKAMREEIIQKALSHTFKTRDQRYEKSRTKLADAIYDHAFGVGEKVARKLPAGWVGSMSTVAITCDGFAWHYKRTDKANNVLRLSRERLQPNHVGDAFTLHPGHPLYPQAQDVAQEHAALVDAKAFLRAKLTTLVCAATTVAKLTETWPECVKFLPAVEAPKAMLPVPHDLVKQVNEMLGFA